jgi:pimeloyl-ACP methyl ester carboxylesterase
MHLTCRLSSSALALCASSLLGCASWLPAPTPMRAVDYALDDHHATRAEPRRCLLVLLPGMGDDAEDFVEQGFVAEVQRRQLSIDVVAAQATLGYYAKGTFAERLYQDVVRPRLRHAYREVWLAGVSMGGMGTLLYARSRPTAEVTGVIAIAPYLGDRDLIEAIDGAGGLARWKAPPRVESITEDTWQPELWRYLQAVTQGRERGPVLHIAYGAQDRLAHADSLLAAAVPKPQVYVSAGGHKWATWRGLFARFLDESSLRERCAKP